MTTGKERVFIHHDGALGDVLLSLPAIHVIRRASSHIHFAGRQDVAELLREFGIAEEISSSGSAAYATLFSGAADQSLRADLRRFDKAFVFTSKKESLLTRALGAVIPGITSVITLPPPGADRKHVAEFRLEQVAAGAGVKDFYPLLGTSKEHLQNARVLLQQKGWKETMPLFVIHPGSGGKNKCWSLDRYMEVAERLRKERRACTVFLSGPAEEAALKERIEGVVAGRDGFLHLCDKGLVTVAGLLSLCSLYIGNDSGISHLAGALDRKVVVIFGPTDPALWRPMGRTMRVVFANEGLGALSVEEVCRQLLESVPYV